MEILSEQPSCLSHCHTGAQRHVSGNGSVITCNPARTIAGLDGVNDGAEFTGVGLTDEQPVLLADGRGANGILDQVVIDLHATVLEAW